MPLSTFGMVLALLYAAFAIWVVWNERTAKGGGGWISLSGMAAYIITLPVSAPLEMLGMRPNHRRTVDMAFAIGVCALLLYLVGAGLEWFVGQLAAAR